MDKQTDDRHACLWIRQHTYTRFTHYVLALRQWRRPTGALTRVSPTAGPCCVNVHVRKECPRQRFMRIILINKHMGSSVEQDATAQCELQRFQIHYRVWGRKSRKFSRSSVVLQPVTSTFNFYNFLSLDTLWCIVPSLSQVIAFPVFSPPSSCCISCLPQT